MSVYFMVYPDTYYHVSGHAWHHNCWHNQFLQHIHRFDSVWDVLQLWKRLTTRWAFSIVFYLFVGRGRDCVYVCVWIDTMNFTRTVCDHSPSTENIWNQYFTLCEIRNRWSFDFTVNAFFLSFRIYFFLCTFGDRLNELWSKWPVYEKWVLCGKCIKKVLTSAKSNGHNIRVRFDVSELN